MHTAKAIKGTIGELGGERERTKGGDQTCEKEGGKQGENQDCQLIADKSSYRTGNVRVSLEFEGKLILKAYASEKEKLKFEERVVIHMIMFLPPREVPRLCGPERSVFRVHGHRVQLSVD
eukprot:1361079-Amorphochlora_amoeboformis.AAC.2